MTIRRMRVARKRPSRPTVDPELKRQLAAAPEGASVQAVFTLRTPAGEKYLGSAATQETAKKVVDEATATAKSSPHRVQVFPQAQSFAIAGPPTLVRAVLRHDAIASAMANIQREDLLIRPVDRSGGPATADVKPAEGTSWRKRRTSQPRSSAQPRSSRVRSKRRKR